MDGLISDYTIITDQSILPHEDYNFDNGIITLDPFQIRSLEVNTDVYAMVKIMKSPISVTYNRSFNKLGSLLSYIGGLFGCIVGAAFFMRFYTEIAF